MVNEILGKGWQFPAALDSNGEVAMSEDETKIEEAVRIIMGTKKGDRVMRPEYGCDLGSIIFNPINATTLNRISYLVEDGLTRFEPRIEVVSVIAEPANDEENSTVEVHVKYRVRTTNNVFNLVYPLYINEGE